MPDDICSITLTIIQTQYIGSAHSARDSCWWTPCQPAYRCLVMGLGHAQQYSTIHLAIFSSAKVYFSDPPNMLSFFFFFNFYLTIESSPDCFFWNHRLEILDHPIDKHNFRYLASLLFRPEFDLVPIMKLPIGLFPTQEIAFTAIWFYCSTHLSATVSTFCIMLLFVTKLYAFCHIASVLCLSTGTWCMRLRIKRSVESGILRLVANLSHLAFSWVYILDINKEC